MRIFEHMNREGDAKCPICGTNEDKPVVLVGIDGTQEERNIEAMQVHVDCLNLRILLPGQDNSPTHPLIYQTLAEDKSGWKKLKEE